MVAEEIGAGPYCEHPVEGEMEVDVDEGLVARHVKGLVRTLPALEMVFSQRAPCRCDASSNRAFRRRQLVSRLEACQKQVSVLRSWSSPFLGQV
jgi:hypothetical protein